MTAHQIVIDGLLALLVLACWVGVVGMLRMQHPTQALHFISIPPTVGAFCLTVAVFMECGFGAAGMKMLLIALVLLAINSVVMHASARAFRTRELGHWEPRDDDPMEFVPSAHHLGPHGETRGQS